MQTRSAAVRAATAWSWCRCLSLLGGAGKVPIHVGKRARAKPGLGVFHFSTNILQPLHGEPSEFTSIGGWASTIIGLWLERFHRPPQNLTQTSSMSRVYLPAPARQEPFVRLRSPRSRQTSERPKTIYLPPHRTFCHRLAHPKRPRLHRFQPHASYRQ